MASNAKEEPKTAPQPDRWYNLTLGPSFKDDSSRKFCTLRYEFKPASIDKTKPGSLKKTKDNRVTVEFQNNQLGKPNVLFKGNSEDYKDNDAVLFFDGQTFRLERLHRAVKQLRHDRQPGESAGIPLDPQLSPPAAKVAKTMHPSRNSFPAVPVEVERIDIGVPENSGTKSASKAAPDPFDQPNVSAPSPDPKDDEVEEHQDIDIEELFGSESPEDENATAEDKSNAGFDINIPHQNEIESIDGEEIADVDVSGDEVDKGPNAAEALRAQVNAEESHKQTSSSSSSSESGSSSGSGSATSSSSSDSEASDDDSAVNSI